jgi:hypothetical protein
MFKLKVISLPGKPSLAVTGDLWQCRDGCLSKANLRFV